MNKYILVVLVSSSFFLTFPADGPVGFTKIVTAQPTPLVHLQAKKIIAMQNRFLIDSRLSEGKIKIVDSDMQDHIVNYDFAHKLSTVKDFLDDCGGKTFRVPKNIHLTKKSLTHITLFDQKSDLINQLSYQDIKNAYNAADYLGASDDLLYAIAEYYLTQNIPQNVSQETEEIKDFVERHEKTKGIESYFKSRNYDIGSLALIMQYNGYNQKLNLTGNQVSWIGNLEDLEYLKINLNENIRNSIKTIDLSHNKIKSFDLNAISKIFPNLEEIKLNNNKIKEIDIAKNIKQASNLKLDLSNNPIESVKNNFSASRCKPYYLQLIVDKPAGEKILYNKKLKPLLHALVQRKRFYHNSLCSYTLLFFRLQFMFYSALFTLFSPLVYAMGEAREAKAMFAAGLATSGVAMGISILEDKTEFVPHFNSIAYSNGSSFQKYDCDNLRL
ncbi:MAG: leucine-rich repeat domain-containing protein [Candidatus Dependentiae bacterium]